MIIKEPTLHQLTELGKQALCAELGVANTIRFLQGYSQGSGNYTVERVERFQEKSLSDLLGEMKAKRTID